MPNAGLTSAGRNPEDRLPTVLRSIQMIRPNLLVLLLPLLFGVGAAHSDSRCIAGEQRQVLVGCRTGPMTYPPRTEDCAPSPRQADWYLLEAALGTRELGGTGAQLTLSALPAAGFDPQSASRALAQALRDAQARGDAARAQSLSRLLQEVRQGGVPLQRADAVAARITLRPYAVPHSGWDDLFRCDANPTAGSCPQATVPPIRVTLVCLPQSR